MNLTLEALGVVLAGLLAGEEFIVRWGVQPALGTLEDRPHILARQALVRRLRVVVPILMVPTVTVGIAVLVLARGQDGEVLRWSGVLALLAFVLFSFLGTVPINVRVHDWDVDDPPPDWRATVLRWQRIDVFRSGAAILAFVCWVIALAIQVE